MMGHDASVVQGTVLSGSLGRKALRQLEVTWKRINLSPRAD